VSNRPVGTDRMSCIQTFDVVLPDLTIESVLDPAHPNKLQLHISDGHKFATVPTVSHLGHTYAPASIATGLAQAIRFPSGSKSFGSAQKLTSTMLQFLTHYAHLLPDSAALLVAFALASWLTDSLPVAPILYLLGPDIEVRLVLRLMSCICRRPVLLADVDMASLATLPSRLNPTLLISQRNLGRRVTQILLASNNPHFRIARGRGQIYAYGAKAFCADLEFANETGVQISLSPALDPLPALTDADEKTNADDLQAKLLRYLALNRARVRNAKLDTHDFVPAMRDEVRAWLAPICDCPDLLQSVRNSLLQQNRQLEGKRFSDNRCLVAEAALFFCHETDRKQFFVRELASEVNNLREGRYEKRSMTNKMAGSLLRGLGIPAERVTRGYRVLLTDSLRERIHEVARDYQVFAAQDGIARCRHCSMHKVTG